MMRAATRRKAPTIYGVLPSASFDDDVVANLRPSREMLADLRALPSGSVVGIGIPFYDNGWVYKGAGGAVMKKAIPYWDCVIGTLRDAGMRLEFLVPPTLKDAEIKHAVKATSADPDTAYKHKAIREYIHHVVMPKRIERSIKEMRPAALLCSQLHARVLAAATGLPFLEETHDLGYLAESYVILKNDNARYTSLQERASGEKVPFWRPAEERAPDDGRMREADEADAPPVLADISRELSMEADENSLNRSPAVPSYTLFAQEMCCRQFRAANWHRVTEGTPSHIGTSSPSLPASGLFELHVKTAKSGGVRGTLEDVVGTAAVTGTIRPTCLKLVVEYLPERCIRDENFCEEYKGQWHEDRYVGIWRVNGTERSGLFSLVPCGKMMQSGD